MNTLIVNTSAKTEEEVLDALKGKVRPELADCEIISTEGKDIRCCIGCTTCWLKTPGVCAQQDDYVPIFEKILKADNWIVVTDAELGFISHKAKRLFDRIIPALNVNLCMKDGMMRHIQRYDRFPSIGIAYSGDIDKDMIELWLQHVTDNLNTKPIGTFTL